MAGDSRRETMVLKVLGDDTMSTKAINSRLPVSRRVSGQLLRTMPHIESVTKERVKTGDAAQGTYEVNGWRRKNGPR